MRIDINIDSRNLKARTLREAKRLAYSTSQALNDTMLDVQQAERINLDRKYQIRQAGFMYRLVKVLKFANPRRGIPYAEVGIDPTKRRVLLPLLQTGGRRQPVKGKEVAVPITGSAARPTFARQVTPSLRFTKMRLRKTKTRRRKKLQLKGQEGTFVIPGAGVFQRIRGVARQIYVFWPKPRIRPSLDFYRVAGQQITRSWPRRFYQRFSSRKGA